MSLIEVLVALGIMSVVLISLGALMFQVARHTQRAAAVGYRSAAVTSAGSWAQGLAWDSIDGATGCSQDTSGLLAYTRCTSVQNPSGRLKEIEVVVTPSGLLAIAPETVVVYRTKPKNASPFSVN
jgi:hypothetical protein